MSADRFALLLPLALAGCGGLVDGNYRGEVLLEIEGAVMIDEDVDIDSDIGVAVLWTNDLSETAGTQSLIVDTAFPARYTLRMYKPPNTGTRVALLGDETVVASIGQIVLYEDLNGDGTWDGLGVEPVVGGAYDSAIVWVDDQVVSEIESAGLDFGAPEGDDGLAPGYLPQLENWSPRPGFQLVEAPFPPACGLPIDDIFFERADNRATLHVGGARNTSYDWDCDGEGEYFEEEPPDTSSDWFLGECQPQEVLQGDCAFVEDALHDPHLYGMDESFFDPFWWECLWMTCPDVMDAYVVALESGPAF